MVFLYILLGIIALIALVLSLSVRITVEYSGDTTVKIGVLFLNFKMFPMTEKKEKSISTKRKKNAGTTKTKKADKESPFSDFTDGLELSDFIEILSKVIGRLVTVFKKHLKVRLKRFLITVSDDSPDKAAIKFGAVTAACSWLFEYLDNNTVLHPLEKCQVKVDCDFDAKKTVADVAVTVRLRVIHVLIYALSALLDLMKIKETKTNSSLKGNLKK